MTESTPTLVRYGQPAGRWVLLATVLGSGMAFIDTTVVNVALQRIGAGLHASAAGLQWTVNGYTLSLAALILLGGSLGDRFGRKRIFLIGVVWFAAASLLCGLAPNIETLIAARVLQGVGGALLTPGSLAILEASFAPEDRPKAIGAWSGLGGIAGAVGPFLGGWLIQVATWRLVFLINAPLAVLVCVVAAAPRAGEPQPGRAAQSRHHRRALPARSASPGSPTASPRGPRSARPARWCWAHWSPASPASPRSSSPNDARRTPCCHLRCSRPAPSRRRT